MLDVSHFLRTCDFALRGLLQHNLMLLVVSWVCDAGAIGMGLVTV
jgi:hypothetical protein